MNTQKRYVWRSQLDHFLLRNSCDTFCSIKYLLKQTVLGTRMSVGCLGLIEIINVKIYKITVGHISLHNILPFVLYYYTTCETFGQNVTLYQTREM